MAIRLSGVIVVLALLPLACAAPPPVFPADTLRGKPVSFALLEDYDKGDDLAAIARDFALMQELEIDILRCSFGWDDYEPSPGFYDFAWLKQFVALAGEYGIQLRPYIGYTPEWAGAEEYGGDDGIAWNNPPRDIEAWADFVYALATALADAPNVLSYEIYNEENVPFWWDGSVEQYGATLSEGAAAIRCADPDAQVLLGGLVYPDDDWLLALIEQGRAGDYDVTPFHAYSETWSEGSVEEYLGDAYRKYFVPHNEELGEGEPIWINEMGYATTPHIEHLGFYKLRDLSPSSEALGDDANYYLGLLRNNGEKKLAFATVDLLTDLLDVGSLVVADAEVRVAVTGGTAGDLHHHLFVRPDGVQVLFVYDKTAAPTLNITLARRGRAALRYELDGAPKTHADFDGSSLAAVSLLPGEVAIFTVEP